MPENRYRFSFDVVAQDRFKTINVTLPRAFYKLPVVLHAAVGCCISDIVFTDEEPNIYLSRLTQIVNSLVSLDENGKLKYPHVSGAKLTAMRSVRTLVGALLCKVYEDDDPDMRGITIDRYGLNEKTFDRYYKALFSQDDDCDDATDKEKNDAKQD